MTSEFPKNSHLAGINAWDVSSILETFLMSLISKVSRKGASLTVAVSRATSFKSGGDSMRNTKAPVN